jgi:hypothetical protein
VTVDQEQLFDLMIDVADNLSVLEVAELLRGAVQPVAEPEP